MTGSRLAGALGAVLLVAVVNNPPLRLPAAPARSIIQQAEIAPSQLPRGGRVILGHYRVVAYYGVPGNSALGVLGSLSPERAASAVTRRSAAFAAYGRTVQPAFELIATVAQASPGPDGDYSAPVPVAALKRYIAAAHRHRMLVVLDLQPGRASFLSQAKLLRPLLLDPSVSIALDPEWKVGRHQKPGGGLIGSSSAAGINAVTAYISELITSHHLPDKLCVIHQFTGPMLPDRAKIRRAPGVEVVFHADGFGSPTAKKGVYRQLAFPGSPYGAGFKLFLKQDSRLMTAAEVMRLRPRPDVITYQ
jgi:hypothetical protein